MTHSPRLSTPLAVRDTLPEPATDAEVDALVDLADRLDVQSVVIGHGRDDVSRQNAARFVARWEAGDGEVLVRVSWPDEAASWLRQSRRLTGPEHWPGTGSVGTRRSRCGAGAGDPQARVVDAVAAAPHPDPRQQHRARDAASGRGACTGRNARRSPGRGAVADPRRCRGASASRRDREEHPLSTLFGDDMIDRPAPALPEGAHYVPGWLTLEQQRWIVVRFHEWTNGPVPIRAAKVRGRPLRLRRPLPARLSRHPQGLSRHRTARVRSGGRADQHHHARHRTRRLTTRPCRRDLAERAPHRANEGFQV